MQETRTLLAECQAKLELMAQSLTNPDQEDQLTLSGQALYGLFLNLRGIKHDLQEVDQNLKGLEGQAVMSPRVPHLGAHLERFLDECCFMDPHASTTLPNMYARFADWVQERCGTKPSLREVGRLFSDRFEKRKSDHIMFVGVGLL